jgi:cholestenol delta-isomerase
METPLHPYFPLGIHIPGYVANVNSLPSLLGQFALLWAVVMAVAWLGISRFRPSSSTADRVACVWFCLSWSNPA